MDWPITYEDLTEICPWCNGNGWVRNPAWAELDATAEQLGGAYDMSSRELDEFAMENGPEELRCLECDGAGRQPTSTGRAILRLVSEFL